MNMHFEGSSSVTLLFDFWVCTDLQTRVSGFVVVVFSPAVGISEPAGLFLPGFTSVEGMALSVLVVLLLTVLYELLKVCKITLGKETQFTAGQSCFSPVLDCQGGGSNLASSPSEISLAPAENSAATGGLTTTAKRRLLHSLQTVIHILQVTLGYMLMLCVMSYNVWIFLGVIVGSVLGYFLSFPLLSHVWEKQMMEWKKQVQQS